jgi:phytoene dehydrogenase-like protein
MKLIIVGAGLAGLTCAKVLRERGAEVTVFEAADGVGGGVRTDEQDGFLLDRGFQVYFTSYPVAGMSGLWGRCACTTRRTGLVVERR